VCSHAGASTNPIIADLMWRLHRGEEVALPIGSTDVERQHNRAACTVSPLTLHRLIERDRRTIPVPISLSGAVFPGTIDLRGVTFCGSVALTACEFRGGVLLDSATFKEGLTLDRSWFHKGIMLCEACIVGSLHANGAHFRSDANFRGCQIGGRCSFAAAPEPTRFFGPTSFTSARFGADVTFNGARFAHHAEFIGIRTEGSLCFRPNENDGASVVFSDPVDFSLSIISGDADFGGAHFMHDANFAKMTIKHDLRFSARTGVAPVRIDGDADFSALDVGGHGDFAAAQFGGKVNFAGARVGSDLNFGLLKVDSTAADNSNPPAALPVQSDTHAHFGRNADFSSLRVGGEVAFCGAEFVGDAVFDDARMDVAVKFQGAHFCKALGFQRVVVGGPLYFDERDGVSTRFEGVADFMAMRVGGASYFGGAEFSQDALFNDAQFCRDANFDRFEDQGRVVFRKSAEFKDAIFHGQAHFTSAEFMGPVDFRGARWHGSARFSDAEPRPDEPAPDEPHTPLPPVVFRKRAEFDDGVFTGGALFTNAVFEQPVSFEGCRFVANATFSAAIFCAKASFAAISADRELYFDRAEFQQEVVFRDAKCTVVYFRKEDSGRKPAEITEEAGRGARVSRSRQFHTYIETRGFTYQRIYVDLDELCSAISNIRDGQSRDQLELALRRMGDDHLANSTYLRMRNKALKERLKDGPREWLPAVPDALHGFLAGYGVRPTFLLTTFVVLLVAGVFVYSQECAVVSATCIQSVDNKPLGLDGSVWMSLDQLLPDPVTIPEVKDRKLSDTPLDIPGIPKMKPSSFATIQSLVGWLFVPIGIAIFAAIMRRQPRNT
jgi:hypothetical protein